MTRLEAIAAAKRRDAEFARMWRNECECASRAISGEPDGGVIVLPGEEITFEKVSNEHFSYR